MSLVRAAVEYGLLVALIAVVIIVMVTSCGPKVLNAFTTVNTSMVPLGSYNPGARRQAAATRRARFFKEAD